MADSPPPPVTNSIKDPPYFQTMTDGRIVVYPNAYFGWSGDDGVLVQQAALQAGGALISGQGGIAGAIGFGPWPYNFETSAVIPSQVSVLGAGPATVLAAAPALGVAAIPTIGVSACLYMHGPSGAGSNRALNRGGVIRDLTFDGTTGGQFAAGLDIGDGWGFRLDNIECRNFTEVGQIAWRLANDQFYTEKMTATQMVLRNNSICCYMGSTVPGDVSHGYNRLQMNCYLLNGNSAGGQNGCIVDQGVNLYNSELDLYGNNQQTANTISSKVLAIQGSNGAGANSIIQYCRLYLTFEADGTGANMATDIFYGSASNLISECQGILRSTGSAGNTNGVTGQLSFGGQIVPANGDLQAIATAPTTWGPPWPS